MRAVYGVWSALKSTMTYGSRIFCSAPRTPSTTRSLNAHLFYWFVISQSHIYTIIQLGKRTPIQIRCSLYHHHRSALIWAVCLCTLPRTQYTYISTHSSQRSGMLDLNGTEVEDQIIFPLNAGSKFEPLSFVFFFLLVWAMCVDTFLCFVLTVILALSIKYTRLNEIRCHKSLI